MSFYLYTTTSSATQMTSFSKTTWCSLFIFLFFLYFVEPKLYDGCLMNPWPVEKMLCLNVLNVDYKGFRV